MSRYKRADRVGDLLKREVSDILQNEMKDPRLGFVTVTDAEISDDLRHAKVFVSVLGSLEKRASTLKVLEGATGFIRTEVGRRIRIRHVPEIAFRYDRSMEYGARINELLRQVESEGETVNSQSSIVNRQPNDE